MTSHSIVKVLFIAFLLFLAFVAGQQSSRSVAAQSRPRWEYQIIRARNPIDEMNKLGEEGWEAVNITNNSFVLLKRSK